MIYNLVFSGGGVKCISYIGLLKYFEENNILKDIKHIIATSGGGIFSLMVLLGYSFSELKELILSIDFNDLKDISCENILKFNENYGIDTGNKLMHLIQIMIEKKNLNKLITFKELYDKINIKFTLTGTCIEKNNIEYFNHELTPDMEIIIAIRITCSIPIIYNCVRYNNYTYIDGGILDNYPIKFCKKEIDNTLGFYLSVEPNQTKVHNINSYIIGILLSMIRIHESKIVNKYKNNTIKINCDFSSIDFNINKNQKKKAINDGYKMINSYFIEKFIKEIVCNCIDNIIKNI